VTLLEFPALKLLWSPGHVLVHGHKWPVGETVPIPKSGLSFGGEGDVRAMGMIQPQCTLDAQLMLQHKPGKYSVINGKAPPVMGFDAMPMKLEHRDLFELAGGTLLRVLRREDVEVRSPTLEGAMEAAPDDAELLHVWCDFLLDHGDPLGERIAKARAGQYLDDDAQWLDAMAAHYEMARLDVTWKNGLAERVVLRETEIGFTSLKSALEQLLSLRVMRFLRELVVDVSSDQLLVKDGLFALGSVALPSTLKSLSLGDVPATYRDPSESALARFHRPVAVGYYRGAQLEVVASTLAEHKPGDRLEVNESFYTRGYGIRRQGLRYRLESEHEGPGRPKIHGKPVDGLPLRDGDIIELGPELTVRFTLVR
jgi:hypothetical protein